MPVREMGLVLLLLAVLAPSVSLSQYRAEIRETDRTKTSVTLEIGFPAPAYDTLSGRTSLKTYPGLAVGSQGGNFILPVTLGRSARVSVVDRTIVSRVKPSQFTIQKDDGDVEIEVISLGSASLEYQGVAAGVEMSRLLIGNLSLDQQSADIHMLRRLVVRIDDAAMPAHSVADISQAQKQFAKQRALRRPNAPSAQAAKRVEGIICDDGQVRRMYIDRDGIYKLTYEYLRQHLPLESIDLSTFRIVNNGQQIPIYVFDNDGRLDKGDYIEFYGERKLVKYQNRYKDQYFDPYTKHNVYYMVYGTRSPLVGAVKRMVEESGEVREANNYTDLRDSAYRQTIHLERESIVPDALNVSDVNEISDQRDHYFSAYIYRGETAELRGTTPHPDTRNNGLVDVRVGLHGISYFDQGAVNPRGKPLENVENEHEASISLNGTLILRDQWDSQQLKFISTDTAAQLISDIVPSTKLLGTHQLSEPEVVVAVQNTKVTPNDAVQFALNWVDIEYDRLYKASNNLINFRIPEGSGGGFYQFTISEFTRSDISIYRKGVSKISNIFISASNLEATRLFVIFQAPVTGESEEFIAVSDSNKLTPASTLVDKFETLKDAQISGEYLLITSRTYNGKRDGRPTEIAQRFAQRAANRGMSARFVDVNSIYDEFNHGAPSPFAIKDFLKHAYTYWKVPPRYVVILGRDDEVHSPSIQSFRLGRISADTWYSMIDGNDYLPDIMVGRIPSRNHGEAENYLDKLLKYDQDAARSGIWKNKATFISGNVRLGGDFPTQITDLLNSSVPRYIATRRVGLNVDAPYFGNNDSISKSFNEGEAYIQFMGHGGFRAWDDLIEGVDRAAFLRSDADDLENVEGTFPFVTSLTCFTGDFQNPTLSLIPALIVSKRGGGAIGGFSTASFGFRDADYDIAETMLPVVFDTMRATWGEKIYRSKIEYYLREGAFGKLIPQTLQYAYTYLGDPTASAYEPEETVTLTLDKRNFLPGETILLKGQSTIAEGHARIEIAADNNSPLPTGAFVLEAVPIRGGTFSVSTNIPANINVQAGIVKVTASTAQGANYAVDYADITFATARITQVELEPRFLIPQTTTSITAALQVPQGIRPGSVIAEIKVFEQNAAGVEAQVGPTERLPMTTAGDIYRGAFNGATLRNGSRIEVVVEAEPLTGTKVLSEVRSFIAGASSDPSILEPVKRSIATGQLAHTGTGLAWKQVIHNWGSAESRNTRIELRDVRQKYLFLGAATVPVIAPHSSATVYIPVDGSRLDSVQLIVKLIPESGTTPLNYRDSLLSNDSTLWRLVSFGAAVYRKEQGTTINGTTHSAIQFDTSDVTLEISPNALEEVASSLIKIDRLHTTLVNTQPDITLVDIPSSRARYLTKGFRIVDDSMGGVGLSGGPNKLSVAVPASSAQHVIYHFDEGRKLWNILQTQYENGRLTASISALGSFAVGYHNDKLAPVIEMSVEGQVFADKGDVPKRPKLSAVIQDANGIDVTPGKLKVTIDGQPFSGAGISILDSTRTSTTINVRLQPELSNGPHTIAIEATDNNGLSSTKQLEVNVSDQFVIQELGVYPNPFANVMFIAYEIRGIPFADEVELNVYTVSGRLIKTHRFPSDDPEQTFGFLKGGTGTPTSLGYHEVWWDGRNDRGEDVANGVYFYRLKVRTERETKEITGKLARIR